MKLGYFFVITASSEKLEGLVKFERNERLFGYYKLDRNEACKITDV